MVIKESLSHKVQLKQRPQGHKGIKPHGHLQEECSRWREEQVQMLRAQEYQDVKYILNIKAAEFADSLDVG